MTEFSGRKMPVRDCCGRWLMRRLISAEADASPTPWKQLPGNTREG